MNWQSVSFDWNQARAFLVTAEEGSLSAAARALGLTQPTLGRQVSALEAELGVTLFERVGRSLTLTQSGLELLGHVKAMGEAANRISLTASGQSQGIDGHVCISASDAVSSYILPPILKQLREAAPGIEIEVLATNSVSDLQQREADIAIRHVRPEQPDLIAKLVRESFARFYASKAYLNKNGRPQTIDDFVGHEFIGFDRPDRFLKHFSEIYLPLTTQNFKLTTMSGVVGWELARNDLGIIIMLEDIGRNFEDMEQVIPSFEPFPVPIWLATHRELHTSRRIRLVFDLLSEALSADKS
ncbi:HTH-type transcriptional regulator GltC [Pseudovibrio axinellae]|uniref:HTH-type transcriptional regulator GltC n=1 Tax=Pseudovibrio axinellae TaxID=989403 RepID=A0A166A7W6_9HYPH|nr:LysR family transcriptional regulator [Pseudovibrio axinellae]KZL20706.1 HTH-type transcriptional regulator GltC [Pseudovibrio axinellae]SER25154.1 transcriptional regulator, LysR family [Pseudovibrio axinellae]